MMRKNITLLFVVMVAMVAFAQKGERSLPKAQTLSTSCPKEAVVKPQGVERTAAAMSKKALRETPAENELVTPPEGVTGEQWYLADGAFYLYGDYGWTESTGKEKTITVIFDGDTAVYIQGLAYWFEDAWIVGSRDGNTITFPSSTFVGEDAAGKDYLVGANDQESASPIVFTYNEKGGTLTCETAYIAEAPEDGGMSWFTYYADLVLSKKAPIPDEEVVPPAHLKTENWLFYAVDLSYDNNDNPVYENASYDVQLGYDGNDVYVQGLCRYIPEAWIKGVRNGDKVTFATGQYLGKYFDYYNLYFVGYEEESFCDVTFTMSANENKLTTDTWIVINGKKMRLYYYNIFTEPKLARVVDVAAVPAAPSVISATLANTSSPKLNLYIPLFDVDDNPLVSSKLYYKLYTEVGTTVSEYECSTDDYYEIEQNMKEIPYNFNDDWDIYPGGYPIYVYGDVSNWRRVGVQSIYYGGGETNASEISWYLVPCDLYIAGSFTNPAWEEGKQQMEQGKDGKYTIDVEFPQNAEFKLLDDKGNWFGGITDGNNFLITEEQLANGTELSLSIPGMNFVMQYAGKYTLTADLENMKLVVATTKPCVKGDVNGDGIVSGADVTALYNVLLDGATVDGDADVNEDGIVNGSDVTALYNLLLN